MRCYHIIKTRARKVKTSQSHTHPAGERYVGGANREYGGGGGDLASKPATGFDDMGGCSNRVGWLAAIDAARAPEDFAGAADR